MTTPVADTHSSQPMHILSLHFAAVARPSENASSPAPAPAPGHPAPPPPYLTIWAANISRKTGLPASAHSFISSISSKPHILPLSLARLSGALAALSNARRIVHAASHPTSDTHVELCGDADTLAAIKTHGAEEEDRSGASWDAKLRQACYKIRVQMRTFRSVALIDTFPANNPATATAEAGLAAARAAARALPTTAPPAAAPAQAPPALDRRITRDIDADPAAPILVLAVYFHGTRPKAGKSAWGAVVASKTGHGTYVHRGRPAGTLAAIPFEQARFAALVGALDRARDIVDAAGAQVGDVHIEIRGDEAAIVEVCEREKALRKREREGDGERRVRPAGDIARDYREGAWMDMVLASMKGFRTRWMGPVRRAENCAVAVAEVALEDEIGAATGGGAAAAEVRVANVEKCEAVGHELDSSALGRCAGAAGEDSAPLTLLSLTDGNICSILDHISSVSNVYVDKVPLEAFPSNRVPQTDEESALALASCCVRLLNVYEARVREIRLTKVHAAEELYRIRRAFPDASSLVVGRPAVRRVPVYNWGTLHSFGNFPLEPELDASFNQALPALLIAIAPFSMRRISLETVTVKASDFRGFMELCVGTLRSVELNNCRLITAVPTESVPVDECSLSLASHSATLSKLVVVKSTIGIGAYDRREGDTHFDVRWLSLPELSSLKILDVGNLKVAAHSLTVLECLSDIEELNLRGSWGRWKHHESWKVAQNLLPKLVNLRILHARESELDQQYGSFLPPRLEFLDIRDSFIDQAEISRDYPNDYQPVFKSEAKRHLPKPQSSLRISCLKEILSGGTSSGMSPPQLVDFDSFLYCAHVVEKLDLSWSHSIGRSSPSLSFFLSQAVNLTHLDLAEFTDYAKKVGEPGWEYVETLGQPDLTRAISCLPKLRLLKLTKTKIDPIEIGVISGGQCRKSLRSLDLRACPNLLGKFSIRPMILHSLSAACTIAWPEEEIPYFNSRTGFDPGEAIIHL